MKEIHLSVEQRKMIVHRMESSSESMISDTALTSLGVGSPVSGV